MSRELLLLVDALAREKNVEKTTVFGALELALASATKKRFHEEVDVRVAIDPMTGNYQSFRRWQVVPDEAVENRAHQIPLSEAMKVKADIKLEEYIEEPLEPVEFGRIGAQTRPLVPREDPVGGQIVLGTHDLVAFVHRVRPFGTHLLRDAFSARPDCPVRRSSSAMTSSRGMPAPWRTTTTPTTRGV